MLNVSNVSNFNNIYKIGKGEWLGNTKFLGFLRICLFASLYVLTG